MWTPQSQCTSPTALPRVTTHWLQTSSGPTVKMGNSRHIPEYQRLSGACGPEASIQPSYTGFCFQIKVLMILLYRAYINNFNNCLYRIGFEVKQLHNVKLNKLDDVVLEYNQNDGTVYRLIQVKHSTKQSKQIEISNLFTETVTLKLRIAAFFTEYQALLKKTLSENISIKDVIIYTNMNFNDSDLRRNRIGIEEISEEDIIFSRRNYGRRPRQCRFQYTEELAGKLESDIINYCEQNERGMNLSDLDLTDFLKSRLTFAVNQPNETELGSIIKREIAERYGEKLSDIIYPTFHDEIEKWINGGESVVKTETRNFFSGEEVKKFFDKIFRSSLKQSNV